MSDGLTHDECHQAAANFGIDLTCGECASVFYTGHSSADHGDDCKTIPVLRERVRLTVEFADPVPPDVMPMIDGRSFRCSCGCNVFRHPEGEPLVFVCNGCRARYRGER